MENGSLILQELAVNVQSTVATYDNSWDCDIYNIWVDSHNKFGTAWENILKRIDLTLYFGVFTSKCSVAVKGYHVKSL